MLKTRNNWWVKKILAHGNLPNELHLKITSKIASHELPKFKNGKWDLFFNNKPKIQALDIVKAAYGPLSDTYYKGGALVAFVTSAFASPA